MTFLLTLAIAFAIVLLCSIGLAIGYLITGKNKLSCRKCGKPEKNEKNCKICGKK